MDRLSGPSRVLAGIASIVVLVGAVAALALSRPASPDPSTVASSDEAPTADATVLSASPSAGQTATPSDRPRATANGLPTPTTEAPSPSASAASPQTLGPWKVLAGTTWFRVEWSPDGDHLLIPSGNADGPPGEQTVILATADGEPVRILLGDRATSLDDRRFLIERDKREQLGDGGWQADINEPPEVVLGEIDSDDLLAVDVVPSLANGTGAVTFHAGGSGRNARFAVWTADGTSPERVGSPVAWSPDGRRLAVIHQLPVQPYRRLRVARGLRVAVPRSDLR